MVEEIERRNLSMRNFRNLELEWYKHPNSNGFFIFFEWDSEHFAEKTYDVTRIYTDKKHNHFDTLFLEIRGHMSLLMNSLALLWESSRTSRFDSL